MHKAPDIYAVSGSYPENRVYDKLARAMICDVPSTVRLNYLNHGIIVGVCFPSNGVNRIMFKEKKNSGDLA